MVVSTRKTQFRALNVNWFFRNKYPFRGHMLGVYMLSWVKWSLIKSYKDFKVCYLKRWPLNYTHYEIIKRKLIFIKCWFNDICKLFWKHPIFQRKRWWKFTVCNKIYFTMFFFLPFKNKQHKTKKTLQIQNKVVRECNKNKGCLISKSPWISLAKTDLCI